MKRHTTMKTLNVYRDNWRSDERLHLCLAFTVFLFSGKRPQEIQRESQRGTQICQERGLKTELVFYWVVEGKGTSWNNCYDKDFECCFSFMTVLKNTHKWETKVGFLYSIYWRNSYHGSKPVVSVGKTLFGQLCRAFLQPRFEEMSWLYRWLFPLFHDSV